MRKNRNHAWTNWSGTVRCDPAHRSRPHSLDQVQAEVLRAAEDGERLRAVGAGHSFTPLCWTDDNQMSLEHFTGLESLDRDARRVWVRAGTTIRRLGQLLAADGLALAVQGDLDAQSLAGALATGTHGSGARFGILASQVTALRLVGADGAVRELSAERAPDLFAAARVSLGALGVVTHVELQCVDSHRLQFRSARSTLDETLRDLAAHQQAHRSFEFWWLPYGEATLLRFWDTTHAPAAPFSMLRYGRDLVLDNGAWWLYSELSRRAPRAAERLGRLAAPRTGAPAFVREAASAYSARRLLRFNELEVALHADQLGAALHQLGRVVRGLRLPITFPIEVRFVRGDDIWLSPAYGRDSAFVALRTWRAGAEHADFFAAVGEVFDRFDGRPHWGKLHDKTAAELRGLYPRFDDFCRVRQALDPRGVFLNPHLGALFGVDGR